MVGADETTELLFGSHRIDIILKLVENSLIECLEECDYNRKSKFISISIAGAEQMQTFGR